MIKNNLPVILLKGLVLLPLGDARIELNNNVSKKVIDISKLYHDNTILIVTPINDLEESPDTSDLPKIGVIAKITSRIDLPNGNTRIVLRGEKRVKVLSYVNYSNEKDVLESIITSFEETEYDEIRETALLRKLITTLDKYISINPYISNSILNQIKGITDLNKLTDYIANFLPLNFEKRLTLMLDTNRISRSKKLITEINIEMAVLELENKIEHELKTNIDELQHEMILKEKLKIIKKELGEKDTKTEFINKINELIEKNTFPNHIINRIKTELIRYENTPETSPEISVIQTYIDYITKIPWSKSSKNLKDLKEIQKNLNKTHYGLTEIKERILEYISVITLNENTTPPIICLVGPPGVGKTTLAESIATALNKKFEKISLGGLNDPAELIGHKKTYIGSSPGKIINALIKTETNNPVILLDEIDKLSKDYKGDPAATLLDILDTNQNKAFIDNYIEEKVDLSKVTWILTANTLETIPYVLKDRLEIIELSSYLTHEKTHIGENYLIKNALNKNGLKENNINFEKEAIKKIITHYTKEAGVRKLDRLINKIIRKIIKENIANNKKIENIIIKETDIQKYLGLEKYKTEKPKDQSAGYIKCIAYTPLGGETLEIEVTSYPGKEEFKTTGNLGETLKESIEISLSYIKAHMNKFKINKSAFENTFHLNFRETGTPKDGPSAGIGITSVILSYLTNTKIPKNISMTGEMTLLGDILPVGGLKEKISAALKENIDTLYIPKQNKREIEELDTEIKSKIKFIFVENYDKIYIDLFKETKNTQNK